MLGVRNYTKEYIDGCRSRVDLDLSTYKKLVAAARNQPESVKAIEAFEATFFNNMVLLLDHFFVHRLRVVEGKDGNPLNEVRLLCDSMMNNKNIMRADKTIKFDPAKSVLKYKVGDEIKLNQADFLLIYKAFFAELESKFL
ncbi:MAG: hypothetical protein HYZ49_14015 [Chloroflexi bacterium]|nr:hypothetical protein [Chloroflexota bacterium]